MASPDRDIFGGIDTRQRFPDTLFGPQLYPRHHRFDRKAETQFGLSIAWEKAAIASADSFHAMLPTAACETWRTMSGLDNCKHSRPKSRVR